MLSVHGEKDVRGGDAAGAVEDEGEGVGRAVREGGTHEEDPMGEIYKTADPGRS